jgi:hypothetical protein
MMPKDIIMEWFQAIHRYDVHLNLSACTFDS